MIVEVKLAQRGALLHLNNEICKVKLKGYERTFTTGGKLVALVGKDNEQIKLVEIKELDELWNVKQITHIELPVSRFTPNKKTFMEVAWND